VELVVVCIEGEMLNRPIVVAITVQGLLFQQATHPKIMVMRGGRRGGLESHKWTGTGGDMRGRRRRCDTHGRHRPGVVV
jgi:hypothetical protein